MTAGTITAWPEWRPQLYDKSAVGPPNLGRAQAPYSSLSFCLLGKK